MYLNYRELDANIIILGAGITGLSAAYNLLKKDPHSDFLVLDTDEKMDFSVRADNSSLWNMRWLKTPTKHQKNTLKLLDELNIPLLKQNEENRGKILVDYDSVHEISGKEEILDFLSTEERIKLTTLCKKIDKLCKKVSFTNPKKYKEMEEYDQINAEDFLNKITDKKILRDVITQTFFLNCGLHPKDVSSLFFLAYCNSTEGINNQFHKNTEGMQQFIIEGGLENVKSKLTQIIGRDSIVPISEISEICWDDYCIGMKTRDQYFFANKLIYTLSETETNNIKFIPPLSDEKNIISNNLVTGTLKNFQVVYERPFWQDKNLSGDVYVMNTENKNGPIGICLNVSKAEEETYLLTGLAEQDKNKNEILEQLAFYLGSEALNPTEYVESKMSLFDQRFPQGCASMNCFECIRVNDERIVWASPETATNWYGTISGSIQAGLNGTIHALHDLHPNILSLDDIEIISPNEIVIPTRNLDVFSSKWQILIPTILLSIFVVVNLKKYLSKKSVNS